MALRSTAQAEAEVLRARLSVLSEAWPRDLMPDVPGPGVAALPPYAALVPGVKSSHAALEERRDPFWLLPRFASAGASNAWAAAPARSAAGGSLRPTTRISISPRPRSGISPGSSLPRAG